jgi:hypothetical protein
VAVSAYALRPSSADRWVHCEGSVSLCAPFPEDDTPEAMEGTAAHWAATEPLAGRVVNVGDVAPNGITITEEMIEGAALYQATVYSKIQPAWIRAEDVLPIPDVHEQNGGTIDTWGLGFTPWLLHVVDYKFGHGFVEVFENWQLLDYVSGIVSYLIREGIAPANYEELIEVELTIVQPRNYHRDGPVRSWRVKLADLRAQFNVLKGAAERAMGPNPVTRTGEWCEYCPARHVCRTLQNASLHIADRAGDSTPFALDPMQLGNELRWLHHARKLLDARVTGLEAEALQTIRAGKSVAHYRTEYGEGREVWREGMEPAVLALGPLLGHDLAKPPSAITPAQARKKGIDAAVISEYAHRPPGALKLVPMDVTQTRKIFGGQAT